VEVSAGLYACEVWMTRTEMTRVLGQVDVGSLLDKQENERMRERLKFFELSKGTEEWDVMGLLYSEMETGSYEKQMLIILMWPIPLCYKSRKIKVKWIPANTT
jgi:hypothetical protein